MGIVIPYDPKLVASPPKFRVLYRDKFRNSEGTSALQSSTSDTDWSVLSEPNLDSGVPSQFYGVELLTIDRRCLPDIGIASFRYLFGQYANYTVTGQIYFLKNKEVRLQLQNSSGSWITQFWGKVDYEEVQQFPGSAIGSGVVIYHCVDGFARTTKWLMDRHHFDGDGVPADIINRAYGNPGYNYQESAESILLGNKSGNPDTSAPRAFHSYAHTWQGAFSVNDPTNNNYRWTERQAIENATDLTRPDAEPWFSFASTAGVDQHFGNYTPLSTDVTETVHTFVSRVVNPLRGKGIVFVDWTDGVGGEIVVFLNFCPLFYADVVITLPTSGGTITLPGAQTCGKDYQDVTVADLNLEGDQRNIDQEFIISSAEMQQFDMVETIGERIEVAATLSYRDTSPSVSSIYNPTTDSSLSTRWSLADVSSFEGLTVNQRNMSYWDHVYQAHGLPRNWFGKVGDSLGGTTYRIDYRCSDVGGIVVPSGPQDTAPSDVEIMGSIPFYYGYDYSGTTPRKTDTSVEYGMPSRRSAMVYLRPTTGVEDRWFYPLGSMSTADLNDKYNFNSYLGDFNPEVTVHPDAILCMSHSFMDIGGRAFADLTREGTLSPSNKLSTAYDITRLAFTVGLRMPHRVRLANYTSGAGNIYAVRRRKTISVPGVCLWLASHNCIWDLQQVSISDEGFLARRGAGLGTYSSPGILRDDRDRLAIIHGIASQYFLTVRQRASWAQNYCGLVPFKRCVTGDPLTPTTTNDSAPSIGQFIVNIQFGGNLNPIQTPVSRVVYNHQLGKTNWSTDWFDLNFNI